MLQLSKRYQVLYLQAIYYQNERLRKAKSDAYNVQCYMCLYIHICMYDDDAAKSYHMNTVLERINFKRK